MNTYYVIVLRVSCHNSQYNAGGYDRDIVMDIQHIENKLNQLLNRIASEQGFVDFKLTTTRVTTGGANYATILYKAKIEDNKNNELNLFIKVAAMGDSTREAHDVKIYDAEYYFYSMMRKIFTDLEDKYKVPEKDRLVTSPYYGANTTVKEEMLVFEDLSLQGFIIYDRFKSIDWPFASASVVQLARFHALSMAFEKEHPEEYNKFLINFKTNWLNQETFDIFWKAGFIKAVNVAKEENKDKLQRFLDNVTLDTVHKIYEPVRKRVLTHADFRPSNLLHRYREDGSVEVIPVDYQTVQGGCLIMDLFLLVFTGSDEHFRREHFDNLMELYYSQLKAAMTMLGLTDEDYSRDDFDFELKEKLPCGLILAAFALPMVTVDTEDAPKAELGWENSSFADVKTSAVYPEIMNGVIDDYVRWGILK